MEKVLEVGNGLGLNGTGIFLMQKEGVFHNSTKDNITQI